MELGNFRIEEYVFEKMLSNQVPDETIKILEITNHCFSEKGLNFLSQLYEVSVKYVVTKESSRNETKESERWADAIIKIEPVDESLEMIGPMLWYSCKNPAILIMENLTTKGFIMKDRLKGMSLEHCRLVIERIAMYHAGSVAIFEENLGMIEWFKDGGVLSSTCPKSYLKLTEVSLLRIGKEIQTWADKECAESGKKLIKLADTVQERCLNVYKYDSDELCVLNHGDCWINNIMFRENEKGEPIDLRLVDYQMAVYSSPAIDLLYFLNICPEFAMKYDRDDYFLEVYLSTLNKTMTKIGCKRKPPTIEQLKEAMHKRRIYAVFAGVVLYLRMMAKNEDTEDFGKVLMKLGGQTKMNVFKNPDAVKLMHKMMPVMNKRGYFD
ncbi:uncharacterized protein LOC143182242 isoform X2 [Calliopsis andreniformis]|uniref:uncharacterized protein LOC143182242 isoform X2 n=1 Tax=Calliopsis andreniformis TaxID=337506 RepID=UPI003FCE85D7